MVSSAFLVSGGHPCIKIPSTPPPSIFSCRFQSRQLPNIVHWRSYRQTLLLTRGKRSSGDDIMMVDPLEAKRLADKQMQELQAKEKLEGSRRAEAINGAWAMIGLTAGLVVEGETGKGILAQLSGYWESIIKVFAR